MKIARPLRVDPVAALRSKFEARFGAKVHQGEFIGRARFLRTSPGNRNVSRRRIGLKGRNIGSVLYDGGFLGTLSSLSV